jgi:hypothetical protein
MAGLNDGIADALFTFSRPVNGGSLVSAGKIRPD